MSESESPISDQILDLLLDALQARQQSRQDVAERVKFPADAEAEPAPAAGAAVQPEAAPDPVSLASDPGAPVMDEETIQPALMEAESSGSSLEESDELEAGMDFKADPPSFHLNRLMTRLFAIMAALIIVINIPFNRYGTSLARAMPDSAALIIRDGLLLKGSGEKVYVLEGNKRRWISSMDAFEEYGYRWERVRQVEDGFLEDFEEGAPIHLLLKCSNSPHIYAIEDDTKRWIKDIPTFEARRYVWEDVRFVPCNYLKNLADGPPIPEDAGEPPSPLP